MAATSKAAALAWRKNNINIIFDSISRRSMDAPRCAPRRRLCDTGDSNNALTLYLPSKHTAPLTYPHRRNSARS